MNSQSQGSMHGIGKRRLMVYSLIASAALAALALTYTAPRAADAAAAGTAAKPVTFEALPSGVKRITLTPRPPNGWASRPTRSANRPSSAGRWWVAW